MLSVIQKMDHTVTGPHIVTQQHMKNRTELKEKGKKIVDKNKCKQNTG